jgi:hypothetical protein
MGKDKSETKPEQQDTTQEQANTAPETESETKPEQQAKSEKGGVKVTKGGISKYVDPTQVADYKSRGWK